MERIVHDLRPDSPEWHEFRAHHDGASEIAIAMGLSKKTSRGELLRMKATGAAKEFSDFVQRHVLDKGKDVEAAARVIVEERLGVELFPVTCSIGRISGSSDGLTMDDEIAWENKLMNQENGPIVRAGRVPDEHMPQCQQVLMVTGAKRLYFTVSDGTPENTHGVWVDPDEQWFETIRKTWAQFNEDLATYQPAEAPAPEAVGKAPEALPALFIQVRGEVTDSNLAAFKEHALAVFDSINRNLVTDADFAHAAKAVTWCGEVESRLAAAKQHALSQTESIDKLFRTIDDISEEARKVRLELNGLVRARKESRRMEILADHVALFRAHMDGLNQRIGNSRRLQWAVPRMPAVNADFAGAIRGLKTFSSMIDKCSAELARAKIEANEIADRIQACIGILDEHATSHQGLFHDSATIALKAPDDLTALIKTRIAEHERAEADRLERQRAEIAEQERVKAEAKARAELAEQQRLVDKEARDAIAKAAVPVASTTSPIAVQACREEDRAMLQTPAGEQLVMAAARQLAAPSTPPSLSLGQISIRLGFAVSGSFLATLGFKPAAQVKNSTLFHEHQFPAICRALVEHIESVAGGVTA